MQTTPYGPNPPGDAVLDRFGMPSRNIVFSTPTGITILFSRHVTGKQTRLPQSSPCVDQETTLTAEIGYTNSGEKDMFSSLT